MLMYILGLRLQCWLWRSSRLRCYRRFSYSRTRFNSCGWCRCRTICIIFDNRCSRRNVANVDRFSGFFRSVVTVVTKTKTKQMMPIIFLASESNCTEIIRSNNVQCVCLKTELPYKFQRLPSFLALITSSKQRICEKNLGIKL